MLNWTGRSSALSGGRRRPRHTTFAADRGAARQAGTGRTSPSRKRKPEHGAMAVSGQGTRRRRRIAANAKHATTARTHGTKSSRRGPRPPRRGIRRRARRRPTFASQAGAAPRRGWDRRRRSLRRCHPTPCEVWANMGRPDHVHRPEPNALNTIEQWVV